MLLEDCLLIAKRPITYTAMVLLTVLYIAGCEVQEDGFQADDKVFQTQDDSSWTIIAVPDTQHYVDKEKNVDDLMTQMEWIADNIQAYRVAFVTQLGDVVQHGDKIVEWDRAERALELIHGLVPYSITIGDHDYKTEEVRKSGTKEFTSRFGSARYQGQSWYGGSSPDQRSHYQIFSAGGRQFLHLNMEWEFPDYAIKWAQGILDQHPELPTIISTHSHLTDKPGKQGRRTGVTEHSGDGNSGETVWKKLIKNNPQIFMVLCGHSHVATRQHNPKKPSELSDDGEHHQVSMNDAGLPVYEMLSDYQDYPNGGDGWIRLIQFKPGAGQGGLDRIDVQTYSPTKDSYQTDKVSKFHFDLSFAERFDNLQ